VLRQLSAPRAKRSHTDHLRREVIDVPLQLVEPPQELVLLVAVELEDLDDLVIERPLAACALRVQPHSRYAMTEKVATMHCNAATAIDYADGILYNPIELTKPTHQRTKQSGRSMSQTQAKMRI